MEDLNLKTKVSLTFNDLAIAANAEDYNRVRKAYWRLFWLLKKSEEYQALPQIK